MNVKAETAVTSSGIQLVPAVCADYADMVLRRVTVARCATGEYPARETQLEVDALFYFLESRIARCGVGSGIDFDGLFARDVTGCLQSIDADVHQTASSGQFFVEPPLGWIADVEPH